MTIWFDVEDLFEYARGVSRPSGIQRLCYEMYAALHTTDPVGVGFVRINVANGTTQIVTWEEIENLFLRLSQAMVHAPTLQRPGAPLALTHSRLAQLPLLRASAQRIPREVRQPLGAAIRAQISVLRHLLATARSVPAALKARRSSEQSSIGSQVPTRQLHEVARPGDIFASFGSPWWYPGYSDLVARILRQTGLRYAVLIYDLIPILRPEYCDRTLVSSFSRFANGCLRQADIVLAISNATARDTANWAAREGIALRSAPRTIPIGTGFNHAAPALALPKGLAPGGYVLFVSTIEVRKNHALAFHAWRRLLDELAPDQVPTLVFAGRVGWLVGDLMQQFQNAQELGGKLVFVENPDDATLAALYGGARFTLFPSLYEGWGLPVSESLSFGKVCIASNATSVPEAGGEFCLYHDPGSVTEATALYRRVIAEPGLIETLEARIRAEYRPTAWSTTAQAVLDALG